MMRTRSGRLAALCAVAVIAALSVLAGVQSAVAERTIALSTGTVRLSLAQGGSAQESLMVANNGDEPLKALVYASDIKYKKDGSPDYVKPTGTAAELLKSPASWLTLRLPKDTQVIANTPYIELEPGEEIKLDFEMNVPGDATPGDYNSVIFFEMFEVEGTGDSASSKVSGRIGARVVVRVAGDVLDRLDLAPYAVRTFVVGDKLPYSFTLSNKGNIDKRYEPYLVVLDTTERERMRSALATNAIIYAQNSREYAGTLRLRNASFGKYVVRAEVDYTQESDSGSGVPEKLAKDRTIYVVPVWFAVLVIAVIGLPLLWLSYRASTRRREPREGGYARSRKQPRAARPAGERAAAREARAAERAREEGGSHPLEMPDAEDVDY